VKTLEQAPCVVVLSQAKHLEFSPPTLPEELIGDSSMGSESQAFQRFNDLRFDDVTMQRPASHDCC
jgi:hypothetical protein